MRAVLVIVFSLWCAPALAWEVTFGAICILEHGTEDSTVRLTFDPTKPEYSIAVTRRGPWA